ncbi:uncharacterized protein PRCAT00002575001 [Priceomyces carsonii]|uniref:uncharacterized protein n=1 Tax=Priceomyces carsonii TaxID=28549 RepID=UPI002ED9BFE1|nr:unnamed protein product [Priceomyces carsonii]
MLFLRSTHARSHRSTCTVRCLHSERSISFLSGSLIRRNKLISYGGMNFGRRTVKTPTIDWQPLKSHNTNLREVEQQAKMPKFRKFVLGLMIAMPVISFFLGCWQVKRLKWKMHLIANAENALAAPPLEKLPPNLDPEAIKNFEYRRFKVKGHFDYSQEMFLGPRMRDGVLGYLLVTPFVRSDGGKPILIERGWIHKDNVIPKKRENGYLSHLAMPQGEIEIEALFRIMPKKSALHFDHEQGTRLFHVCDVNAMAKQSGALPIYCQMIYDLSEHPEWKQSTSNQKLTPSILNRIFRKNDEMIDDSIFLDKQSNDDATLEYQQVEFVNEGVPIAATPNVKFTNNHLQYLITWFGLSICSAGLLVYSFWKKRKFLSAEKIIEAKRKDMRKNF